MKVLIIGGTGHLGAVVAREFAAAHEVVAPEPAELDVTNHAALDRRIDGEAPAVIVNCAAYNDVDGAEEDARRAMDLNAFAVRALASAAARHGAVLVHYSTDFVFDGCTSSPYVEEDEPNPQSVYASSKLLGDLFAREAPRHYVLRVESLFGAGGGRDARRRSSVDAIAATLAAGGEARAFSDRVVSPSHVGDIARATRQAVERQVAPGLYHCVNDGYCTWYELAVELQRLVGNGHVVPVKVADMPLRARRPQFAALSNAKLAAAGIVMRSWREALAGHLSSGS